MLQVGLQVFLHIATLSFRGSGNWASQAADNVFNSLFPAFSHICNGQLLVSFNLCFTIILPACYMML